MILDNKEELKNTLLMEEEIQQNQEKKQEEKDFAIYNFYLRYSCLLSKKYNLNLDTKKKSLDHFASLLN